MPPIEPALNEAAARTILRTLDDLRQYEGWDRAQVELRNTALAALAYWQAQKGKVAA